MRMQGNPHGNTALQSQLARVEHRRHIRAYALILPLFIFILITFVVPIFTMLFRSVDNPLPDRFLPETLALLSEWEAEQQPIPPEAVYATLARELGHSYQQRTIGKIATRVNYESGGTRSLIMKTGRRLSRGANVMMQQGNWTKALIKIDKRWGKREIWATLRTVGERYTLAYYLAALDRRYDWDGTIVAVPEYRRIYLQVFGRTFWISLLVTVFCGLLGYPVAYLLANLSPRVSNLLMIMVLLPFWTSLLVRTTAWVVILQKEGVLNDLLIFLGLIDDRIQLIFNRFGVIVAMTHILLPFMILPIYSVMKTISPLYMRAAQSLGATPFTAFWRVYFPQSVPGMGAGGLLVFILALGYYITPALVGGPTDQMVSYFIADHTNRSLNWGLASALGGLLLASVLVVYWLYNRLVGLDNMKLG
ncbi:ABC transporter permease [Candidatus Entotheonella palauensis]|uniref:Polyamine ABC transporter substrate-binding protein n=1 Tax=Candidatus Entotheonella gemina TaxID=1429439 RepID=W4M6T7_9BACT|nr:ABC transporter permease [Candidatus Entotheonella palauensis]ETX06069.1 MAG: polyamine ABC transporter substrate-binding protein [Candidatus Entotheonella gemina]